MNKETTKIVKKALSFFFPNVKVSRGSGTTYNWVYITIGLSKEVRGREFANRNQIDQILKNCGAEFSYFLSSSDSRAKKIKQVSVDLRYSS